MVQIKYGYLFPWQFLFIGALCVIVGVVLFVGGNYAGAIPIIPGILILTATNGTEIDIKNKRYREYKSILFYKMGGFIPYTTLDKLYINSVNMSQGIYTKVTTTSTIRYVKFNAYLVVDEGITIELATGKVKNKVIKKLGELSRLASLEILDHTTTG